MRALALGVNWFSPGSGGLDRVFCDLLRGLPDAGIDVSGLVLGPPDAAASRLLRARRAVAASLAPAAPDIVAAHFALFAWPALDLLRRQPLVVHFHGPWADEAAEEGAGRIGCAVRHRLERAVYRRAARVITLSRAFARLAETRYGVAPELIRVVPGGVDVRRFAPTGSKAAARAALGWPADRPVLLSVRRLVRRMGLDRLIEAMQAVCAAVPGTVLMIAGGGAEEAFLKALAGRAGVAAQVRFLGILPEADLPLAYRAADITVVPSRALEGFGLVAAESLAAGTPSIVTPVGGLPEVVATLSGGLVFRSAATADIAAGVIAALRGGVPGEDDCHRYAQARFCAARMVADTARIYREAKEGCIFRRKTRSFLA